MSQAAGTDPMCREEFPRLYELRDHLGDAPQPDAYNFAIGGNRIKLKHFRDIEAELRGLDPTAWALLKTDVVPLLVKKDSKRGWQAMFDKLNEAKGYNYLVRIGCSNVEFVPRLGEEGGKTPDLQGNLGRKKVLCEVKTINISDVESGCRNDLSVRQISAQLPHGFFTKLRSDLEYARSQMSVYDPNARKIAYVVVNHDDLLHEYAPAYCNQINEFIAAQAFQDLEVVPT